MKNQIELMTRLSNKLNDLQDMWNGPQILKKEIIQIMAFCCQQVYGDEGPDLQEFILSDQNYPTQVLKHHHMDDGPGYNDFVFVLFWGSGPQATQVLCWEEGELILATESNYPEDEKTDHPLPQDDVRF